MGHQAARVFTRRRRAEIADERGLRRQRPLDRSDGSHGSAAQRARLAAAFRSFDGRHVAYAGDTSVDFSWYAKRAALAGVYKSTELSMIQDQSPDFEDTWQF